MAAPWSSGTCPARRCRMTTKQRSEIGLASSRVAGSLSTSSSSGNETEHAVLGANRMNLRE
eukprot:4415906-Amphidinium_carterae.1